MADLKITELPALTTVLGEDLLAIVDDPTGTASTKKIRTDDFFAGIKSSLSNYSGTSTIVGWSSLTTRDIVYWEVGDTVFVNFAINGVSDDTVATFTLPYSSANAAGNIVYFPIRAANNGAQLVTSGMGELVADSATVTCYLNWASAAWISSNAKYVMGQFFYKKA